MSNCSICGNSFKIGFPVFEQSIGTPAKLIRDIIQQCVGVDIMLVKHSQICKKCFKKLKMYYEAKLEMQLMQRELIQLFTCFTKRQRDNETYNGNDKIKEEVVSFLEVQMDEKQNSYANMSSMVKREISDEVDVLTTNGDANESNLNLETCFQPMNKTTHLKAVEDSDIKTELGGELNPCNSKELCKTERKNKKTNKRTVGSCSSVCDQCGKKFYSYTGFMYHYRTHDSVKQFKCSICSESYVDKYRLRTHMAYHTGETPFECDICGKKFVHKTSLKKHKEIHDEKTRRIQCGQCDFKFRSKSHLRRHMVTHTGAKPFQCPECGKGFTTSYGMKLHLREHQNPGSTRQQRYRCKMCPRTFTNKHNFDEHCERKECNIAI